MKTVDETMKSKGQTCVVAKKGKSYIGWKNGEFSKTSILGKAIAFASAEDADRIINNLIIDTRNARVIGNRYSLAPITMK